MPKSGLKDNRNGHYRHRFVKLMRKKLAFSFADDSAENVPYFLEVAHAAASQLLQIK